MRYKAGPFIFIPSTESHFNCFYPLSLALENEDKQWKIYYIKELVTNNRHFNDKHGDKLTEASIAEFLKTSKQFGKDAVVIVGNDSDINISKILRKLNSISIKTILLQDGWLDERNILQPLYPGNSIKLKLKKRLHRLLTKNWMPTKPYVHNLIGQNSKYFLVYSDIAKQNFIAAGIPERRIYVTGSPRHNQLKELKPIKAAVPKIPIVVLFSDVMKNDLDEKSMFEAVRWLKSSFPNTSIILKAHPMENVERYQSLVSDQFMVLKCSLEFLVDNYVVKQSFCFSSTVIFDMLILDIPIIQLAPLGMYYRRRNYFPELGIASTEEELQTQLKNYDAKSIKTKGIEFLKDIDSNYNSVQHTTDALIKISEL